MLALLDGGFSLIPDCLFKADFPQVKRWRVEFLATFSERAVFFADKTQDLSVDLIFSPRFSLLASCTNLMTAHVAYASICYAE